MMYAALRGLGVPELTALSRVHRGSWSFLHTRSPLMLCTGGDFPPAIAASFLLLRPQRERSFRPVERPEPLPVAQQFRFDY